MTSHARTEQYKELRRKYQAINRKYCEAKREYELALHKYQQERGHFVTLFKQKRPIHAAKIEEAVADRNLPDPDEAFAVIAGVMAVRREPTEV